MKEGDIVKIVSDICPASGYSVQRGTYTIDRVMFYKNSNSKKVRDIPYVKMALLNRIKDDSQYGWVASAILLPVEIEELI